MSGEYIRGRRERQRQSLRQRRRLNNVIVDDNSSTSEDENVEQNHLLLKRSRLNILSNYEHGGPSILRNDTNSDVEVFEADNNDLMITASTNYYDVVGRNQQRGVIGYRNIARNYRERLTHEIHHLNNSRTCPHCDATLFQRESSQLCCLAGKLKLPRYTSPPEMLDLFSAQTTEGRHFRQYIRVYNNAFAFTSMGVHYDESLAGGGGGVYTFRAHGAIYHRIGSLLPIPNARSRYAQSYILDTEHEVENRMLESNVLQRTLVVKIQCILERYNPFVHVLRQMGQRQDLPTCKLVIKCQQPNMHQYSLPTTSQVAAVIVDGDGIENLNLRDIIVQSAGGNLINIPDIAGYYDPLQYVLMLPYGSYGWDVNTKNINGDSVTCRAFYSHMLQIRPNDTSLLLRGGRLLQQYVVDTYVKIETQKLRWIKDHQHTIRADLYKGLQDYISIGENDAGNVGRKSYVLPSSFAGSKRDQNQRYQDSMALVHRFGMPDFMITITCNQNWREIKEQLLPGQSPQDRPDLICRIFKAKLEEFKQDIIQKCIFGRVASYAYVVEYQKRGLPHAHMLIILSEADKLRSPDEYDTVVRAEIPSQDDEPVLYAAVIRHMIHGPHDSNDRRYPCMKHGSCKKGFPKQFCNETRRGQDSYPIYRRRCGPPIPLDISNQKFVDNGWVVPYNPWLLLKYDCHINVEVTSSIKCVKYLYKYVYKGPDRVMLEVRRGENNDEIQQFVDGRWISAPEALWRIYSFEMSRIYPSVYRLPIHLPDMQTIRFMPDERVADIIQNERNSKTMLTEFFVKNRESHITGRYLYHEFPNYFVWNGKRSEWTQRVRNNKVIGRIYTVSPSQGDKFYLRLMLHHVRGPRSFEELRTVDSHLCATYKEAAEMLGVLETNDYVQNTLEEASGVHMPSALRRLFVSLLVTCNPSGVPDLWLRFHQYMMEDYNSTDFAPTFITLNALLKDIDMLLQRHEKTLSDYDLPTISEGLQDIGSIPKIILDEFQIPISSEDVSSVEKLNSDQLSAFNKISEAVDNGESRMFFIDGPGGTGKTFLYRVLLANVRTRGHIGIAVASSGIAATCLPGGRTAHSRFKIPLRADGDSYCGINLQSDLAELMRWVKLVVWDEAPMTNKYAFHALDKTLQDIMKNSIPFGGKIIVFGGDFRQVLPIVKKGNRCQQVAASISKSSFWTDVEILRLRHNMRSIGDNSFSEFLLRVGDGREPTIQDVYVKLPEIMVIPWENEDSVDVLIESTFPNMNEHIYDSDYMVTRAIITPKNADVDKLNKMIIEKFPGQEWEYSSWDVVEDDVHNLYQPEFLNSLCPNGLPPNKLILKIGSPIMLLRNLDPQMGLCNGTRLICRNLTTNFIDAEIITGHSSGTRVFLHRMPLNSEDDSGLPFVLRRNQFPVRVSFALTINKSQGQTIRNVGIFLRNHVFGHGQLYVALSRGVSAMTTKVLVQDGKISKHRGVFTKNIVYKEVLLPGPHA